MSPMFDIGVEIRNMKVRMDELRDDNARLRAALQELRGVAFHNTVLHPPSVIDFIDAALAAKAQATMTPAQRAEYRHQVFASVRHLISQWNDTAQVLHSGHIIDLSELLTKAIIHPNSLAAKDKP